MAEEEKAERAANRIVRRAKAQAEALALVADRLNNLRYGQIEIRVYRGTVSQIRVIEDIKVT